MKIAEVEVGKLYGYRRFADWPARVVKVIAIEKTTGGVARKVFVECVTDPMTTSALDNTMPRGERFLTPPARLTNNVSEIESRNRTRTVEAALRALLDCFVEPPDLYIDSEYINVRLHVNQINYIREHLT